ncbi:MAG: hypothetical protein CBE14_002295 [Rickettsiales bacterium TMED254]|nr:MAG: hypothetical protein CBE14_002295 [Rickettsiales bacterium TMED254]
MAANTYLRVTEVDFNDIRTNLKSYLQSQTQFNDYDFEGSNMSVLLDVLAYNTHYNAFYTNMLGNEMFLDTAQQRDSVVSRAKELGYLTRSARGATANVSLTFTGVASNISEFTLPKNSTFTTSINDRTYTYVTPESNIIKNVSGAFSQAVQITEGVPITHEFTVSDASPVKYILPNENVDTRSIRVRVKESSSSSANTAYTQATNIREVNSKSAVFYLQETHDKQYEILFGTGSLGRKVSDGNIVQVDYRVCNGTQTNGANVFSIDSLSITPSYTSATLSVNTVARGGVELENIDSIKFNAPRNYKIQNRAVVAKDFERIILNENTNIASTVAFGGEEAIPPVHGKVYIAIKPQGELIATETVKQEIENSIQDRTMLGIDPVIIDPVYLYIVPTVNTFYDTLKSTVSSSSIQTLIRNAISDFSTTSLEQFGKKLRYSRFVRELDNVDDAVLNNEATFEMQKRFVPSTSSKQLVKLEYHNAIEAGSLLSTSFTFNNFTAFIDDDGLGNVRIFRFNTAKEKVSINSNAGTIDYTTGEVNINDFLVSAFDGIEVKVNANPVNKDIVPVREQVIIVSSSDAVITTKAEVGD